MKSVSKITAGTILLTIIHLSISCSKSGYSSTNPNNTAAVDSVTSNLIAGNWVVASLTQKLEDNTSKFKDYQLKFAAGGKLTAIKNNTETQGTWTYTPAVTYYGSSSKEAMQINMGTSEPFKRLTGTWNIVSRTETSIKMDNPEVLEDEHLQIQRQ